MSYQTSIEPYVVTTLAALYLPVPFYLLALHALHNLWRRIGLVASYTLLLSFYAGAVLATVKLHGWWLWHAWDRWPQALSWLAVLPLGAAAVLAVVTYTTIEPGTLHLARQLNPSRGRPFITTGILGAMRHPRYVMFILIALGNALIAVSPLVTLSLLVTVALFTIVIRLEENELRQHFGDSFDTYKKTVPAFFPRLRRAKRI